VGLYRGYAVFLLHECRVVGEVALFVLGQSGPVHAEIAIDVGQVPQVEVLGLEPAVLLCLRHEMEQIRKVS